MTRADVSQSTWRSREYNIEQSDNMEIARWIDRSTRALTISHKLDEVGTTSDTTEISSGKFSGDLRDPVDDHSPS
jgi:hypothetical protein